MATPNLFLKTAAPLATNDGTQGYVVGDIWEDTTHKQAYYNLQITTNNAIWAAYPALPALSITKTGPSTTDNGHFALVNDLLLPGNNRFYGTSPSGVKGWQNLTNVDVTIGASIIGASGNALLGFNSGVVIQIGSIVNAAAHNIVFGTPSHNGYASFCDQSTNSAGYFYDDPATPLWPVTICNNSLQYALQCADQIHSALFCNCPASGSGGAAAQFADTVGGVIICNDYIGFQIGSPDFNVTICDYNAHYGISVFNTNINVYLGDVTDKVGLISGVNGTGYTAAVLSNTYFIGYFGGDSYAASFLDSINNVIICNDSAALTVVGQTILPTLTAPLASVLTPIGVDTGGIVNLAVNAVTLFGNLTTTTSTPFKNAIGISLPPNTTWILDFNIDCSSTSSSGLVFQMCGGLGLGTTTLTANVLTTDTTINVANGAQFPVGSIITVDSEEMGIVSIASNVLTVTRAVNGTALDSHTSGGLVYIDGGGLGQTVLTANVLTTDTTISVTDGTQFVIGTVVTVGSEQMIIVSKAGNVLTVGRGYNATTIATHSTSDVVFVGSVTLFCNGNTTSPTAFGTNILKGVQNPTTTPYSVGFTGLVNIKAVVRLGNQGGPVILQFASSTNGELSTVYDSSYVTATASL